MKFQTTRSKLHRKLRKKDFPEENELRDKDDCNSVGSPNSDSDSDSRKSSINRLVKGLEKLIQEKTKAYYPTEEKNRDYISDNNSDTSDSSITSSSSSGESKDESKTRDSV